MIVAMFVQTIYSLVDTYRVSGQGADALAAMGFVFPFYFIAFVLDLGQVGAWWGIVAGNGIGSLLLVLWARYFLRDLLRTENARRIERFAARGAESQ